MPHWTLSAATRTARPFALAVVLALLVGCGGSPPAGTAGSPSTAAQPTGSSTAKPSTASTGPDPDAGAAVDAFKAFIQTDQSFHLAGDMLMTVGDLTLQAAIVSDVSNGDEQGTIDLRGPGVSIRLSIVLVDRTAYLRVANRDWQVIPGEIGFSNPLAGLHVEGMAPVDIVKVNGITTHHLHVDDPEGFNGQTLSGNTLTDLKVASSSLDVYITEDGVPLTAIAEFAGSGTFGGKEGKVIAKIRYDFSKFGQEIKIVAPIAG